MLLPSASYQPVPQILVFYYCATADGANFDYYTLNAGAAAHFRFIFMLSKEFMTTAKTRNYSAFLFLLKSVTRPMHFTSELVWKLVLFLRWDLPSFLLCLFSIIMYSFQHHLLNVVFQKVHFFRRLFSYWEASMQTTYPFHFYLIDGCRNECFLQWNSPIFFFTICSSQQNVNCTLSVTGAFSPPCSVKEIWLLVKPAFTQHISFIIKLTRPTHLASWAGMEVCAWPVWCSTPFIFFYSCFITLGIFM